MAAREMETARWKKGQHMKEEKEEQTGSPQCGRKTGEGGGEVSDKTTRETWNIVSELRKWKGREEVEESLTVL